MKKTSFNNGWKVRVLGSSAPFEPVLLPHDAMRFEKRVADSAGAGNIAFYEGLDYEYTLDFTPDQSETQIIEFESVYKDAEVYINDQLAAKRPYGYTNFFVDAVPYLKKENNTIRVIARNSDQPNSRWYSGTGIYRPVWLYTAGKDHILPEDGIRIRTLSIDPAVMELEVRTTGEGEVKAEILDAASKVVKTITLKANEKGIAHDKFTLEEAQLWDPEHPCLYTIRVFYKDDSASDRFGIRVLSWDAKNGIAINGKRVILRGGCFHHDNGVLGAETYPEAERRRVRILQSAGYNAIRSAHNPVSKTLLDVCDETGMLMMDEYVDCWYMHKTENDYASYVEKWWKKDMLDMVNKDYNHPCVIMYSTGNEVAETAQKRGIKLQRQFTEYLHSLDDSRPVTCGINIFFNFLSSIGLGVYSDEKAKKQAEEAKKSAEKAKAAPAKKNKPVGSEFFNVMAAHLGTDFMKFGASLPMCDWKTKDAFAVMDIAGYNYGNWRYKHDCRKYPERLILGSETLCSDAYSFWETAKEYPQVVGDFVWVGWDYIGECGESSPEYDDYVTDAPEDRVRGGASRIDMTGKLTPEADFTRVAFELEKGPRLAVYPVYEDKKPVMTGWVLTRAMRSWSYPGCDGKPAEVEVYARCAYVELLVNGEKVGRKSMKNKIRAIFKTTYHDGTLEAVSYDENGKEIGRDILRTAKEPTELRLEPEVKECAPGEMLFLRVRYTDPDGEVKPMEKHTVSFTAENGKVEGTCNASCFFKGNFCQDTCPTYFGEAQVVVRADKAGIVKVTAKDTDHTVTTEIVCK